MAAFLALILASSIVGYTLVAIGLGVVLVLQRLYMLGEDPDRLEAENPPVRGAHAPERALRAAVARTWRPVPRVSGWQLRRSPRCWCSPDPARGRPAAQTITEQRPVLFGPSSQRGKSEAWSTRRERVLPPDRIAQLARGEALVMIGAQCQLCPTSPYHQHPSFATLANPASGPSRQTLKAGEPSRVDTCPRRNSHALEQ